MHLSLTYENDIDFTSSTQSVTNEEDHFAKKHTDSIHSVDESTVKTRELPGRALGTLSDCESSNARSGKPVTIGIEKEEREPPTRCMYGPSVSLAEEHRRTYPVPSGVPPPIPTHSKPSIRSTETRTSHQRRFAGAHKIPHTAPWVAQQLHESKIDTAIGILASWTHPKRRLEVSEATIAELNQLPDDLVVDALKELKGPKKYVQGIGGTKLEMRVILETKEDNSRVFETKALLDSGCTGSCINRSFVEENHIPTIKLARPIPVYNADGTLNQNGAITDVVELHMAIQDHKETIRFAVSNLGKADVFLGHDWLVFHNPSIDWKKSTLHFENCASKCIFFTATHDIDDDEKWSTDTCQDEIVEEPIEKDDQIFVLDADAYFETLRLYHQQDVGQEINKTNYDYIFKYDPSRGDKKDWQNIVPAVYHDYEDIFTKKDFDKLPERRPWDHAIELTPGFKPVDCKTYPLSKDEQAALYDFLAENIKTGRIRPSTSPMASPFFFVKKKDGRLRPTQDYRKLNDATIKNRYPLPLIGELVDTLSTAKIFTKMDVRWGYNNIRIKDGDEWKAAFRTNQGLYEPTVMFFGLTNSPATFQNFMDHIFKDLVHRGVVTVYMDDILIFTNDIEEHIQVTREVLKILRDNNLFLKPEKCVFHADEVEYLGMIVGKGRVKMDPTKIAAIRDWDTPTKKKELQRFLGFCNYYRRFIKDYSLLAKPLTTLTGNVEWQWTENEHLAFERLIHAITSEPVLALPRPKGQFCIEADASDYAIGAVLSQLQDGRWHPIAFLSKALQEAQIETMKFTTKKCSSLCSH